MWGIPGAGCRLMITNATKLLIVRTVAPDTKGQPVKPLMSGNITCNRSISITKTFGLTALFFIAVILCFVQGRMFKGGITQWIDSYTFILRADTFFINNIKNTQTIWIANRIALFFGLNGIECVCGGGKEYWQLKHTMPPYPFNDASVNTIMVKANPIAMPTPWMIAAADVLP